MIELGNVYVDMGKKKHAFKLYKKAVKINPDYPDSHFFLGRLYFQMQKFENITSEFDIFRAKTRSFSELDDTEKNVYIKKLYYIGDVYFNLKKYPNMKLIVDEILKINPNDQYGYYNLGVYYYMYKRSRSKAYEIFQKVIDINPHSEAARDARYAIEFMRNNPDPRLTPDFSFIDRLDEEY